MLFRSCVFRFLPRGFTNSDLRPVMAQLLGVPAEIITPGKMTYDLRRLRYHGLIERVPRTFRYQVTGTSITQALFLTRLHDQFLRTGLAALTAPAAGSWPPPAAPTPPPSTTLPAKPASPPDHHHAPQAHNPDLQTQNLTQNSRPWSPKIPSRSKVPTGARA